MRLSPLLIKFIRPRFLIWCVSSGVLAGVFAIFFSWALSSALAEMFIGHQNLFPFKALLGGALFFALARMLLSTLQAHFATKLARVAKSDIRNHLLQQESLNPTPLLRGVEALESWYSQYLPQVFLAIIIPLMILILTFWLDPLSGLVFLLSAPLLPIFLALIGLGARAKQQRQWKLLLQQGNLYQETLLGLKTLKLFGKSKDWGIHLAESAETLREATLGVLRIAFLSALVLELVGTIGTAILAVELGIRLLHGGIDYQRALFLLLLAPEFYLPLRLLGLRAHAAMEGDAFAQTLVASTSSVPDAVPASVSLTHSHSLLEIRNLSARWPEQARPVFQNLDMTLAPGEFLGIAGPSGCGKSTLFACILGQLPAETGAIHFKQGIRILWIPQSPRIYHRSIRDNILQSPEASHSRDSDIWLALEKVGLLEFIRNLPLGLDTSAAEGGARLSGGQLRRLALARAFLEPCDLILMDEPDAHLDQDSLVLLEDLVCSMNSVARIVISHREQTLAKAHSCFRMEVPC